MCIRDRLKQALGRMMNACVVGASEEGLRSRCGEIVNATLRLQAWPAMQDQATVDENWQALEEGLLRVAECVVGADGTVAQLLERCGEQVRQAWGETVVQADILSVAMQRLNIESSGG